MYPGMSLVDFQEDVRITIPAIVECMKDVYGNVRKAAINAFSMLATQGMR